MLSTAYVNQYPTRINGLILAEPGGFLWQDVEDYVKRSRDFDFTRELTNDLFYHDQFITGKEDEHAILDYKYSLLSIADGHEDNPTGNEGRLPLWRAGAVAHQALFEIGDKQKPDWTTHLNKINTKVLFAYSENNKAYGLQHAQKVSSAYPNVQLVKVNGAGHDMLSFPTGWSNFFPVALAYLNVLK
jgi:proline iminopeptidase